MRGTPVVGHGELTWEQIPHGAIVATSSLRRRAQLLHLRPDVQVTEIRGNVDTRLAKLEAHPEWTAILLAAAGLVRLGLGHRIGDRLPPELFLPAPGQGALAVTARSGRLHGDRRGARRDPPLAHRAARCPRSAHSSGGWRAAARFPWLPTQRTRARPAACGCMAGSYRS